jgi:hypothetical protein
MIECNAIFMILRLRVSAIGGSASDANRQIARSTAKRNNERRVDYGIEIRQWRRRACSSASCHARESGHLETFPQALDSRLRGNDNMIECNAIFMIRRLRVSAVGGSASDADRQSARSTAN